MSDTEKSSSDSDEIPEKYSANLRLVNILKKYDIIFNKSQVPKIKEKKEQAYKEIHKKYILEIGKDMSEKQLRKKIQNMKTELKKKTDTNATGNKKIILNVREKQLLTVMEGKDNPVFQKVPGATTKGILPEEQPSSKTELLIPSQAPPLPSKPPVAKKNKFNETEETSTLSNSELQRLVLLEQLELIRVQKEKEKLILEKIRNENASQIQEENNLVYRHL